MCGAVATDETIRSKIGEALDAACLLVTQRTATLAETGHSTFQPTEDDPAVIIFIDEVDEMVKHVPGAGRNLEFLAGKQRKAAVGLALATQRAVISALGGGVRAYMTQTLVGATARSSESRHATGAESEIPDIREYAKGAPGYFQRWNPLSKTVTGRGRAFQLGKDPDELAYMKRIVAAREHLRDWSIPDLPPLAVDGTQTASAPVTDDTAQHSRTSRASSSTSTRPSWAAWARSSSVSYRLMVSRAARSAGSPAASASQWSPARQMATESSRANRPANRPPIRSFSFTALPSKGW